MTIIQTFQQNAQIQELAIALVSLLIFLLLIQIIIGLAKKTTKKKRLIQQPGWIIIFISNLLFGLIGIGIYLMIKLI